MHWYKLLLIFPSGPLHRDRPGKQRPQDTHCQNQAGIRAAHLHWLVPGLGLRLLDQRPPGAHYGRTGDLRSPSLPFYQPRPLTAPPSLYTPPLLCCKHWAARFYLPKSPEHFCFFLLFVEYRSSVSFHFESHATVIPLDQLYTGTTQVFM